VSNVVFKPCAFLPRTRLATERQVVGRPCPPTRSSWVEVMPTVQLKFCALRYLNQWLEHDRIYCEGLAGNDEATKLKALNKAAVFYRVSRNLPERYDRKKGLPRFKPVLDILDTLAPANFHGDALLPGILRVRDQISAQYGTLGVLSLTTKFLWVKFQWPIIIYDSKARSAVGARTGDLADYYARWRQRFNEHAKDIEAACNSLQNVVEYSVNPDLATPRYVQELSGHQWFRERVFDIYLWHLG